MWDKVREELGEVESEMKQGRKAQIEEEFGDLFFALVNAARLYGVDPEQALEKTNRKFIRRFHHIEERAEEMGKSLTEMSLAEMDSYWEEAKRLPQEQEQEND